jgi:hypothetical protein
MLRACFPGLTGLADLTDLAGQAPILLGRVRAAGTRQRGTLKRQRISPNYAGALVCPVIEGYSPAYDNRNESL